MRCLSQHAKCHYSKKKKKLWYSTIWQGQKTWVVWHRSWPLGYITKLKTPQKVGLMRQTSHNCHILSFIHYWRNTYYCEGCRRVTINYPTYDFCVVVPWKCINSHSEVVDWVIKTSCTHKAFFLKVPHGTLTINWCVVYNPYNILSFCKTLEVYNGSNWHSVVHRPLYYSCLYADKKNEY